MPIRRKKKHQGEVNMSSMTDIIFMLLIFFMLTSTLVKFLPFKLPESDQRTTGNAKTIVSVEKNGRLMVNNVPVIPANLEPTLRAAVRAQEKPTITIAAELGVPFDQVTRLMAIANRLKARTVLATAPRN